MLRQFLAIEINNRKACYRLPGDYAVGKPLLMEPNGIPLAFPSREEEIITWCAVCAHIGEALIKAQERFAFSAKDVGYQCHQYQHTASEFACNYLAQENLPSDPPQVFEKLEQARKNVRVYLRPHQHEF